MTAAPITAARRDELRRVAAELAGNLENLPTVFAAADWQDHVVANRRRQDAAERLAEMLRRTYGATISEVNSGGGGHRMSMLGVRTTCTSGLAGLFRNWITAAERTAR